MLLMLPFVKLIHGTNVQTRGSRLHGVMQSHAVIRPHFCGSVALNLPDKFCNSLPDASTSLACYALVSSSGSNHLDACLSSAR